MNFQIVGSLELNIEAALYNEHILAWEPFIEPIVESNQTHLSPCTIICSIKPVSFAVINCKSFDYFT